jgi:hypothetical protein
MLCYNAACRGSAAEGYRLLSGGRGVRIPASGTSSRSSLVAQSTNNILSNFYPRLALSTRGRCDNGLVPFLVTNSGIDAYWRSAIMPLVAGRRQRVIATKSGGARFESSPSGITRSSLAGRALNTSSPNIYPRLALSMRGRCKNGLVSFLAVGSGIDARRCSAIMPLVAGRWQRVIRICYRRFESCLRDTFS